MRQLVPFRSLGYSVSAEGVTEGLRQPNGSTKRWSAFEAMEYACSHDMKVLPSRVLHGIARMTRNPYPGIADLDGMCAETGLRLGEAESFYNILHKGIWKMDIGIGSSELVKWTRNGNRGGAVLVTQYDIKPLAGSGYTPEHIVPKVQMPIEMPVCEDYMPLETADILGIENKNAISMFFGKLTGRNRTVRVNPFTNPDAGGGWRANYWDFRLWGGVYPLIFRQYGMTYLDQHLPWERTAGDSGWLFGSPL